MKLRLATALLVAFALGLVLLHALDPRPLAVPLSAFSVGPFGWLYRAAFAAATASLALMALGTARWARIATAVAAAGAALAALFPSRGLAVSATDRLHLAGTLLFLVGASGALWLGRRSPTARLLALGATFLLAATLALKAEHSSYAGHAQRLLVALLGVGVASEQRAGARPRSAQVEPGPGPAPSTSSAGPPSASRPPPPSPTC